MIKHLLLVRSEILGAFRNTLAADHMYSRHNWGKFMQNVKTPLSQKGKTSFEILIAFLQSIQNFSHFQKKGQLYSLNSWEVIDSEKCGCLNAPKLLFQKIFRESKCPRVKNTAELCTGATLLQFPSNPTHFESENICFGEIWNLRSIW